MADIVLRESFWGGYEGSISSEPSLSWSDSLALSDIASAASASAEALAGIGDNVEQLQAGVSRLESSLGLRLDEQTELLAEQVNLLASIDESLRTPAKTRAAERLADVAELLRRGRHDRALVIAEAATGDDPNNPAGFTAAGWALIGLNRMDEARAMFTESAVASDGDAAARALRQAARLALALDDAEGALGLLGRAEGSATSDREVAGIDYDRAVYLLARGEIDEACRSLDRAGTYDGLFCVMGLADPLLTANERLRGQADSTLLATRERVDPLVARAVAAQSAVFDVSDRLKAARAAGATTVAPTAEQDEVDVIRELGAHRAAGLDDPELCPSRAEHCALRCEEQAARWAALDKAAVHELRLIALEEAVERFAEDERAHFARGPDETWEIHKVTRLGSFRTWRGSLDAAGKPQIERT